MEKQERDDLLRDVLDAIDEHVAACGIPEERTGYNVLAQRVTALFADYDALEADLAHCRHTRRLQADARAKERAKLAEAETAIENIRHDARERPWMSLADFVMEFDAAREGE